MLEVLTPLAFFPFTVESVQVFFTFMSLTTCNYCLFKSGENRHINKRKHRSEYG